jgi:hypothetical protein
MGKGLVMTLDGNSQQPAKRSVPVKARRQSASLALLCDASFVAFWLASAVGHAWLLWARWGALTPWQVFLLGVAVVSSLALAPCGRWMRARPARLLIVILLVCLAHVPAEAITDSALALLPTVVAVLSLAALGVNETRRRLPVTPRAVLVDIDPDLLSAKSPPLCFALFRRPPPTR